MPGGPVSKAAALSEGDVAEPALSAEHERVGPRGVEDDARDDLGPALGLGSGLGLGLGLGSGSG